ncbi:MAG TPA: hypothetical protein VH417_06490 [Vicinamibacterales bacterium]
MKWRAVILGVVIAAAASPIRANDRLALRVSPTVSFAPANLVVRATVEANRDNRSIEIVAESEDFYRSSEMSLDGDRAPRTSLFEFRSLPTGSYQVRATLRGVSGKELASMQTEVNVVGSEL